MPLREQYVFGYPDAKYPDETDATRWEVTNVPERMLGWSFTTNPSPENLEQRMALMAWTEKLDDPQGTTPLGVVLLGGPGLGKTGAMVSALRELANQRVGYGALWFMATRPSYQEPRTVHHPSPVWFETWRALRDRLIREDRKIREPWMQQLEERVAVLGLDDIDSDTRSRWKEDKLLELVERPYNGLGLIITTNAPRDQWARRFGERTADRMRDRSAFMQLEFSGVSRRDESR
jgi:DNA replication protein DnaC